MRKKSEARMLNKYGHFAGFPYWGFEFVSDFELRISSFRVGRIVNSF